MEFNEIIKDIKSIRTIENMIYKNAIEFINDIYKDVKNLIDNVKDNDIQIELSSIQNNTFSIKLDKYEIFVFLMDEFAVPKNNLTDLKDKNITLSTIANSLNYQKYYCGCLSFYYIDNSFSPDNLIYLDRAFINRYFEIAFQSYGKYLHFEKKESVISILNKIIMNIFERIIKPEPVFPETNNIFQLNKSILKYRKYNTIGFK